MEPSICDPEIKNGYLECQRHIEEKYAEALNLSQVHLFASHSAALSSIFNNFPIRNGRFSSMLLPSVIAQGSRTLGRRNACFILTASGSSRYAPCRVPFLKPHRLQRIALCRDRTYFRSRGFNPPLEKTRCFFDPR